jgi:predicted KAP-like P-loop ATPase
MNRDLDATRFINDDYILACSFDNGQVLFMNSYQDQSPIIVNSDLQRMNNDYSRLLFVFVRSCH